jgi:hypothetical protein
MKTVGGWMGWATNKPGQRKGETESAFDPTYPPSRAPFPRTWGRGRWADAGSGPPAPAASTPATAPSEGLPTPGRACSARFSSWSVENRVRHSPWAIGGVQFFEPPRLLQNTYPLSTLSRGEVVAVKMWRESGHHSKTVESSHLSLLTILPSGEGSQNSTPPRRFPKPAMQSTWPEGLKRTKLRGPVLKSRTTSHLLLKSVTVATKAGVGRRFKKDEALTPSVTPSRLYSGQGGTLETHLWRA